MATCPIALNSHLRTLLVISTEVQGRESLELYNHSHDLSPLMSWLKI